MDDLKVVREGPGWYECRYLSMYDIVNDTVNPMNESQLSRSLDGGTIQGLKWLGTSKVYDRRDFAAHIEKSGTFDDTSRAVIERAEALPDFSPGVPRSTGQIVKRHRRRDSFGDHVDIHAINQGLLDVAWTRTERHMETALKTRVARIYIHIGGLYTVDATRTFWRAAAAIRIADALTSKGFSVEITGGASANDVDEDAFDKEVHTLFTIKSSGQPLNRERLACQATIGWHRIFCFKARACCPFTIDSGLGRTIPNALPPYILDARDKGELVIHIPADVHSKIEAEACLANARAELERYTASTTSTPRPAKRA